MKRNKLIVTAITGCFAFVAIATSQYIKMAKDRLYRMAAGESSYERKHKRR